MSKRPDRRVRFERPPVDAVTRGLHIMERVRQADADLTAEGVTGGKRQVHLTFASRAERDRFLDRNDITVLSDMLGVRPPKGLRYLLVEVYDDMVILVHDDEPIRVKLLTAAKRAPQTRDARRA